MKFDLLEILRKEHGFEAFRPGQLAVLEATLAGKDVLAVLPTGAGKSLCYQMASRCLPGLTVVVSPLIALMKDQVDKMLARGDRGATCLNSALLASQRRERWQGVLAGRYRLLYVSPEALRQEKMLQVLRKRGVSLLAIDEAHCISHWGHDFRPDYTALGETRRQLGAPQVLAMTATATVRVRQDIVESLGLDSPEQVVLPFDRPELELAVRNCHGAGQKRAELRRLLAEATGPAIVYVGQRKQAEAISTEAAGWGHRAAAYHAGLGNEERERVQDAFMKDELDAVVATNAFGMGVDKPDIRLIVEYTMPSTPEAFYQEAGRAGRDGRPAKAVLLFDERDRAFHEALQSRDAVGAELLHRIHQVMLRYRDGDGWAVPPGEVELATGASEAQARLACSFLERAGFDEAVVMEEMDGWRQEQKGRLNAMVGIALCGSCRRREIRRYFGEKDVPERCGACDVCLGQRREMVSAEAKPGTGWLEVSEVLRFVDGLQGTVGRSGLEKLLRAEKAPLAWMGAASVRSLLNGMLEADLLRIEYRERDRLYRYPLLRLGPRGQELIERGEAIQLRLEPAGRSRGRMGDRRQAPPQMVTGRPRQEPRPESQEPGPGPAEPVGARLASPIPVAAQSRVPAEALDGAGGVSAASARTEDSAGVQGQEPTTAVEGSPGPIQMLRCGAFYEFRHRDAETAARLLGLKLGQRGRSPLTGVPVRKGAEAAERLRARGYAVEMLRKSPGPDGKLRWAAEEDVRA